MGGCPAFKVGAGAPSFMVKVGGEVATMELQEWYATKVTADLRAAGSRTA